MNNHPIATIVAAALAATASAQGNHALLFTTSGTEQTRSGSAGTYLSNVDHYSIDTVTPVAALTHSAEKFLSNWSYQTLAGDSNGPDGVVTEHPIMGGVDAVLSLPYEWNDATHTAGPRTAPVTPNDTYISPVADVGTNVSGGNGLRKSDCGRFVRNAAGNGQVEYFITAEQIIASLGLHDPATGLALTPQDFNLDAIAVSANLDIFLSFDEDLAVRLWQGGALHNFVLQDGAIACIPQTAWTPNANGEVGSVVSRHGIIAFDEVSVDLLVAHSNAADNTGVNPTTIGDTEGLAIDIDNGGTFPVYWGNGQAGQLFDLANLLVSGTTLTGAGVISTFGGGTIAVVNGCALAASAPTPTYGRRMGLSWVPPNQTQSCVENLETLAAEPCYFAMATPNPRHDPVTGAFEVHIGTNLHPVAVVLLASIGELPVSQTADPTTMPVIGSLFAANQCFQEYCLRLWPAPFGTSPLPGLIPLSVAMTAAGGGDFGVFTGTAFPTPYSGGVLFQAVALDAAGNLHLSAPGTID
ncbi:MAG TPA: hypothetical protein VFZ65_19040 [Planctomycetota bacterium]|nr:hypothetical protein [Planctomycetota bacterium]